MKYGLFDFIRLKEKITEITFYFLRKLYLTCQIIIKMLTSSYRFQFGLFCF